MSTTKILVAANSPATLRHLQETLSGLEVHVAIRLRDVAKAVKQGDFALLVCCLGFDEQSAAELLRSLHGEPPAIACIACDEPPGSAAARAEALLRAAGAHDFFRLADYPRSAEGNARLRARLLACAGRPTRLTPYSRTLYRAALLAGGTGRLAAHLQVSEEALREWIDGTAEPPMAVFLAALELVLDGMDRGSRKPS